jgi:hypothetical protein
VSGRSGSWILWLALGGAPAWGQSGFFDTRVAPILSAHCAACHNNVLKNGGVSFLDRDGLLKGGTLGPTIVPGKPAASMLMVVVLREGPVQMPPGAPLAAADIATLEEWIRMGAPWGTKLRPPAAEVWRFDNLEKIGGHKVTVEGHPKVVEGAVEFNGVDDGLFLDVHPLAGAEAFTFEAIIRPDLGGRPEQRFFHLQEDGSETRMLLEIRVTGNEWCLDAFAKSGAAAKTLIDRERLHALGEWYDVAMVYDGSELRSYVNGVLEGAAPVKLAAQGAGRTSVGVRIDRRDHFKGAIARARFTRGALAPEELMGAVVSRQ